MPDLSGYKTYITAIAGIIASAVGYFGFNLTAEQVSLIASIFVMIALIFLRQGSKTDAGTTDTTPKPG